MSTSEGGAGVGAADGGGEGEFVGKAAEGVELSATCLVEGGEGCTASGLSSCATGVRVGDASASIGS